MGGSLFFCALVVVWTSDVLVFDRTGSISLEFDRHVVEPVVYIAGGRDGSFMALLVMARKGFFLSVFLIKGNVLLWFVSLRLCVMLCDFAWKMSFTRRREGRRKDAKEVSSGHYLIKSLIDMNCAVTGD